MPCHIPYIPKYLHSDGRQNIDEFYLEELLFRRCNRGRRQDPFDDISLVDLSMNRGGPPNGQHLCKDEDVLYNTTPEDGKGEKYDMDVSYLRIKELDSDGHYRKELSHTQENQGQLPIQASCLIRLRHKMEECNYPHSAFEFYYGGVEETGTEVTFANYKTTLGRQNRAHSALRTMCKHEISKMIVREEVRINWNIPEDLTINKVPSASVINDKQSRVGPRRARRTKRLKNNIIVKNYRLVGRLLILMSIKGSPKRD